MTCLGHGMLLNLVVGSITLHLVSSAKLAAHSHTERTQATHLPSPKNSSHVEVRSDTAEIVSLEKSNSELKLENEELRTQIREMLEERTDADAGQNIRMIYDPMDFDPMGSLGRCFGCSGTDRQEHDHELALKARRVHPVADPHPKHDPGHVDGAAHGDGPRKVDVAAHGDGHHHDYTDPVTGLVSMMLFGCVSWVVSMFYFVNYPDEEIQHATWTTLSTMISIFAAVLLFSATTETLVDFAGLVIHHHGEPSPGTLFWGWFRWIVLTLLHQIGFVYLKDSPYQLKVFANIGGHLVGFGAIDAFGVTLHISEFSNSCTACLMGVVLAMIVLMTKTLVIHWLRLKWFEEQEWSGKESWIEVCTESESESLGLSIGLFWSMLIRFSIAGTLPAVHGDPQYKNDHQVWLLFASSLFLVPMVVWIAIVRDGLQEREANEKLLWFFEVIYETCQMAMGWTLLYWGYWYYYDWMMDKHGSGGKVGMRIIMAIMFSALSFMAIVWIDFVADRTANASVEKGMRSMLKTFALLMGLAWEATFTSAVKAIGHEFEGHEATFVIDGLVLTICAVVLPAWALYIFPKTFGADGNVKHVESNARKSDLMRERKLRMLNIQHEP